MFSHFGRIDERYGWTGDTAPHNGIGRAYA